MLEVPHPFRGSGKTSETKRTPCGVSEEKKVSVRIEGRWWVYGVFGNIPRSPFPSHSACYFIGIPFFLQSFNVVLELRIFLNFHPLQPSHSFAQSGFVVSFLGILFTSGLVSPEFIRDRIGAPPYAFGYRADGNSSRP